MYYDETFRKWEYIRVYTLGTELGKREIIFRKRYAKIFDNLEKEQMRHKTLEPKRTIDLNCMLIRDQGLQMSYCNK